MPNFLNIMNLMDEFHLLASNPREIRKKKDYYGSLIIYYGNYLGTIREKILELIDEVIIIIEDEKENNS